MVQRPRRPPPRPLLREVVPDRRVPLLRPTAASSASVTSLVEQAGRPAAEHDVGGAVDDGRADPVAGDAEVGQAARACRRRVMHSTCGFVPPGDSPPARQAPSDGHQNAPTPPRFVGSSPSVVTDVALDEVDDREVACRARRRARRARTSARPRPRSPPGARARAAGARSTSHAPSPVRREDLARDATRLDPARVDDPRAVEGGRAGGARVGEWRVVGPGRRAIVEPPDRGGRHAQGVADVAADQDQPAGVETSAA